MLIFFRFQPRQNLLNAASRIGEASHDIMEKVGPEEEADAVYTVRPHMLWKYFDMTVTYKVLLISFLLESFICWILVRRNAGFIMC